MSNAGSSGRPTQPVAKGFKLTIFERKDIFTLERSIISLNNKSQALASKAEFISAQAG